MFILAIPCPNLILRCKHGEIQVNVYILVALECLSFSQNPSCCDKLISATFTVILAPRAFALSHHVVLSSVTLVLFLVPVGTNIVSVYFCEGLYSDNYMATMTAVWLYPPDRNIFAATWLHPCRNERFTTRKCYVSALNIRLVFLLTRDSCLYSHSLMSSFLTHAVLINSSLRHSCVGDPRGYPCASSDGSQNSQTIALSKAIRYLSSHILCPLTRWSVNYVSRQAASSWLTRLLSRCPLFPVSRSLLGP